MFNTQLSHTRVSVYQNIGSNIWLTDSIECVCLLNCPFLCEISWKIDKSWPNSTSASIFYIRIFWILTKIIENVGIYAKTVENLTSKLIIFLFSFLGRIIHPIKYYRNYIAHDIRPDGREFEAFRPIRINAKSIGTADGSAIVKLGNTTVICGIKAVSHSPCCTSNANYFTAHITREISLYKLAKSRIVFSLNRTKKNLLKIP